MQPWLDLTTLAYLDPGTGSYALQLLLASLFGGLFVLRQSWSDLKLWASARFGRRTSGERSLLGGIGTKDPSSTVRNARHHAQPATKTP